MTPSVPSRPRFRLLPLLLSAVPAIGAGFATLLFDPPIESPAAGPAADEDVAALLDGVQAITTTGGGASVLAVFGPSARVVAGVTGEGGNGVVVASARLGQGRIVAWGHDGHLDPENLAKGQSARLVTNAITWSAGKAGARVGVVGDAPMQAWLKRKGVDAVLLQGDDWTGRLRDIDVIVTKVSALAGAAQAEAVRRRVQRGAGLLIADTAWGWLQLNPGRTLLADHPGNLVTRAAGIVWTTEGVDIPGETFRTDRPLPAELHAGTALDTLIRAAEGPAGSSGSEPAPKAKAKGKARKKKSGAASAADAAALARGTLALAVTSLPSDDAVLLPRVREASRRSESVVPTPKAPVKADDTARAARLVLVTMLAASLPAREVRAHPAASEFPGAVPDTAERVRQSVPVRTAVPGWHSTGLYAPPGAVVTVTIPEAAAGKGLAVRIGCHVNRIWEAEEKEWRRVPEVTREWPLAAARTETACAFGGLVYVVVPDDCKAGRIDVVVEGAVRSPRFVLGRTTRDEWLRTQVAHPGPWAEFESDRIILTVPSRAAREVRDPVRLMQTWNRILDAIAELATIPPERKRPERFVVDEQTGWGYMHSGYPIMAHLDVEKSLVSVTDILGTKVQPVWGFFHELGHNHQIDDWTFDGLGEVTCNVFAMYVLEHVCGRQDRGLGLVDNATAEQQAATIREYLATGRDYAKWDSHPFAILLMYDQLIDAFGWDAIKGVFAEYRKLPEDQRPKTMEEKRDQWLIRMSRQVKRNLGPFFTAWGLPTSDAAQREVSRLPRWMPAGFPPK